MDSVDNLEELFVLICNEHKNKDLDNPFCTPQQKQRYTDISLLHDKMTLNTGCGWYRMFNGYHSTTDKYLQSVAKDLKKIVNEYFHTESKNSNVVNNKMERKRQ